ncbi:phosphopantetheine adenylyltransferase / dephospho-CoA kinase [Chaetoceros tenuissimus]|uniref:Phosphopantetheine adenylyltransferase / dephospho-CoA kinase n=1 Tax=Chaetoceros tenuissimus TaxID=426638 RepID=A0AAD3HEC5_9STRA|nr:phosphopantetheine adenylyltransferase / dephospho-CoA kinase [Chaetoceros tenuissimus]
MKGVSLGFHVYILALPFFVQSFSPNFNLARTNPSIRSAGITSITFQKNSAIKPPVKNNFNTRLGSSLGQTLLMMSAQEESFSSVSVLGVCGSIGAGKSYFCSLLTSKLNDCKDTTEVHAHHIDTDSLAHGVYAPGSKAIEEIGQTFGQKVIADGTVNRKALGTIVFSDPSEMQKLERLVWPHVKDLLLKKIDELNKDAMEKDSHAIVIVEAAVLLDANWDENHLFDGIWIVRASEETSCKRLVEKRGMDKDDALNRMNAQQSRRGIGNWKEELKSGNVTAIIENDGNEESELWDKMKKSLVDPDSWKNERVPPISINDFEI